MFLDITIKVNYSTISITTITVDIGLIIKQNIAFIVLGINI